MCKMPELNIDTKECKVSMCIRDVKFKIFDYKKGRMTFVFNFSNTVGGFRMFCLSVKEPPSVCVFRLSRPSVYSCALLRDILLQGRLYISRHWLCFYANLFGKDIKVGMT